MPNIDLTTWMRAPLDVCFDLARDIDLHIAYTEGTRERAAAGVTSGLINPGEEVTWAATHFGIRQRLTSRITLFNLPYHFSMRDAFSTIPHWAGWAASRIDCSCDLIWSDS